MSYTTTPIKNEINKEDLEFINKYAAEDNRLKKLTYCANSFNAKRFKAESLRFFCV